MISYQLLKYNVLLQKSVELKMMWIFNLQNFRFEKKLKSRTSS